MRRALHRLAGFQLRSEAPSSIAPPGRRVQYLHAPTRARHGVNRARIGRRHGGTQGLLLLTAGNVGNARKAAADRLARPGCPARDPDAAS